MFVITLLMLLDILSLQFNYLSPWEIKTWMISSGILTSIRLSFAMRHKDRYDIFRYSNFDSTIFCHEKCGDVWCLYVFSPRFDYLSRCKTRSCMMSAGILTLIRLSFGIRNDDMYNIFRYSHFNSTTFRHEKRRHVWYRQVFSLRFNYLSPWETRTAMMSSGILTQIQLPFVIRNNDTYDIFDKYNIFIK